MSLPYEPNYYIISGTPPSININQANYQPEYIIIDSGSIASGSTFNNIDVFLVAGQSNAQGQGTASASPVPPTGTAFQYYSSSLSALQDPVGNAASGSAWPSFAIKYYNLTKRKLCIVPTAVPSTSQTAAADPGNGTWDTTGTLFTASISTLNNALTALTNAGYTPLLRGILWCQGESDAGAITAATITKAQYKTALQTMITNYRTSLGSYTPFYIFRTGGSNTTGRTAVMEAQEEVADADYYTTVVFRNAIDFPIRNLQNGAHYLQEGYNEMGDLGAVNIVNSPKGRALVYQYDKTGIGTKFPTASLHVTGGVIFEGEVTPLTTLGSNIGTSTGVWNIGYFKTINAGTGNAVTLRSGNANQAIQFLNGATEAARFSPTNGNLIIGSTTDVSGSAQYKLQVNGQSYFTSKQNLDYTITTAGTTGNRTINKPMGTVNIAAAASSVVVTNNLCTTASIVYAVLRTNDSTATIKNVVPASGSFTITLGAAANAEVSIGFILYN